MEWVGVGMGGKNGEGVGGLRKEGNCPEGGNRTTRGTYTAVSMGI